MFGKPFWLLLIFCTLFISIADAQQNVSVDTVVYSDAAKQVIDNYNTVIADQSEVFNGVEYYLYPPAYKGSAYFMDKTHCTPSSIFYNGTLYKNIPVIYDMYTDVMVAALKDSLFTLRTDKASDIYLLDHHFIYLYAKNSDNLNQGYYDELYDGKSQVLVKRVRTVKNNVTEHGIEVIYENKDVIYIKKGNNYSEVNSKGSVLDIFKDKKKQLNQYLNDSHVKYRNDKEGSIIKLAGYYDQISH